MQFLIFENGFDNILLLCLQMNSFPFFFKTLAVILKKWKTLLPRTKVESPFKRPTRRSVGELRFDKIKLTKTFAWVATQKDEEISFGIGKKKEYKISYIFEDLNLNLGFVWKKILVPNFQKYAQTCRNLGWPPNLGDSDFRKNYNVVWSRTIALMWEFTKWN